MRTFSILLLISVFGFFIDFSFMGQIIDNIIKILLFITLGYLLYKEFFEKKPLRRVVASDPPKPAISVPRTQFSIANNIFTDNDESISSLINDESLSINSLLLSQFEILFTFFMPTNGYIFIENPKNAVNLFFKKLNDVPKWNDSNVTPYIIKLLKNHTDEILVENNLKQESTVLPYYEEDLYKPLSIFAYRIYLSDDQAIYFVFDSGVTGFFNSDDFNVPVQAGFTLQFAIRNAVKLKTTTKMFEEEKLKLNLNTKLNYSSSKEELINNYVEFLSEIFEAHKLTVALVDESNKQVAKILKTIGQVDSIKEGTRFALDEGLCGKVIVNDQIYLLEDIEKDGYFIPRFSKNEKTNYGLRSFLAMPIKLDPAGEAIGMVSLEHKNIAAFNVQHKNILKKYTSYFEKALSRFE